MASESSDERVVTVTLPAELDDWLEEKAAALDVDEGALLVQLLSSYRAAQELDDGSLDPAAFLDGVEPAADASEIEPADVEPAVRDVIAERISDIAAAVEDQRDERDDVAAVEDRLESELDRLERDIESAESTFQSRLEDVRERVIQVKKETDAKAPADHDHAEFENISRLRAHLEDLESTVTALEDAADDHDERLESIEDDLEDLAGVAGRLDDLEERLNTVAWVVSDLRDAHQAKESGTRAIDRLKRSAAKADVDRAVCDNCENTVDIALLSEPKCPHCGATVSDVELPGGFFGKPRLTVAKQLESGEDDEDDASNVPDAARR